jgi:aminomethyltransferase
VTTTSLAPDEAHAGDPFSTGEDVGYLALRESVGFATLDTVEVLRVVGPDARGFVQSIVARDIEFIGPDQAISTLIVDESGHPVDVVHCNLSDDAVEICTGFGRADHVRGILTEHAWPGIEIGDDTEAPAVVTVEGPYAWSVIGKILDPGLASLPFEGVASLTWRDHPVVFSRQGYTAEYGYQFRCPRAVLEELDRALDEQAQRVSVADIERAMIEVRQPVLELELLAEDSVVSAGLNWLVDLAKPEFLGHEAVRAAAAAPPRRLTIGFIGPTLAARGDDLVVGEQVVGTVVHGIRSPKVGGCIGLARIDAGLAASGLELTLRKADGDRTSVRTASSPYITPASWHVPII